MAFLTATPSLVNRVHRYNTSQCSTRPTSFIPNLRIEPHSSSILFTTIKMTRKERTFVAVKPDGMNRGLLGNIITRFEAKGYKLVAIKTLIPTRQLAETHYAALSSKSFFSSLVDFITSGPVCAMVWEGESVVKAARAMIGETSPLASPPGTIRGDFGVDVGRNVIHGSDAVETAEREIGIWFDSSEITNWAPTASVWIYE